MGEQGRGLPWGLLAALLGSPLARKSWAFSGAFCSLFFGWGRDVVGGETRILRPLPGMSPPRNVPSGHSPSRIRAWGIHHRDPQLLSRCSSLEAMGGAWKPQVAPPALPRAEHHPSPPLREHFSHFPQPRAKLPAVPCRGQARLPQRDPRLPAGSPSPAGEPTPPPTPGRARYLPPCPGPAGGPACTSFWLLSGD